MEDHPRDENSPAIALPSRDRWLGALCYLSVLVFIPMLTRDRTTFVSGHVRQGFALFFAELVALAVLFVIEESIGRIPVLGFIVTIILRLVVYLAILLLSVMGFIRAAAGETFRIPVLEELSDRMPIQ